MTPTGDGPPRRCGHRMRRQQRRSAASARPARPRGAPRLHRRGEVRLLKEWAYAGVVFTDTGAIASHLVRGYALGELTFLIPLLALTALSWWSRPPSRHLGPQRSERT